MIISAGERVEIAQGVGRRIRVDYAVVSGGGRINVSAFECDRSIAWGRLWRERRSALLWRVREELETRVRSGDLVLTDTQRTALREAIEDGQIPDEIRTRVVSRLQRLHVNERPPVGLTVSTNASRTIAQVTRPTGQRRAVLLVEAIAGSSGAEIDITGVEVG